MDTSKDQSTTKNTASSDQWIELLSRLAESLHKNGVPAHRLEMVVQRVGTALGLEELQVFSIPTFLQIYGTHNQTAHIKMLRVQPGQIDIARLQMLDQLSEEIADHRVDITTARQRLREINNQGRRFSAATDIFVFGILSFGLNLILQTNWSSALASMVIGMGVGAIITLCASRPRFALLMELLAALFAAVSLLVVQSALPEIDYASSLISTLIVLLPGLTLTTAMMELTTGHLVAGTARSMLALTILLKLFFGVYIANHIFDVQGPDALSSVTHQFPEIAAYFSLPLVAVSFIVLFRISWKEFLPVLFISTVSFLTQKWGGQIWDVAASAFVSAFIVAAVSNLYARWRHRPVSTLLLPGILLLVPGSIGYQSIVQLGEKNVISGVNSAFQMLLVGGMIVGGILIANFFITPRREF